MSEAEVATLRSEMEIDYDLVARCQQLEGTVIIKAAGNMAYPMGIRSERLARESCSCRVLMASHLSAWPGGALTRTR
jgi:hypothetical protein